MKEVHNLLLSISKKKTQDSNLIRLNIRVPEVRKLVRKTNELVNQIPSQRIKYWDKLWKETPYFEAMSLALYSYQYRELSKSEFNKISLWVNRVSCWEHSDDLSKIYAQVVESNPAWILPKLKNWNKSKNLWKRRQSLVSLIEYASKRKQVLPFKELISFVLPLLGDSEYYVQKGLGWTMREIHNVYPKQMLAFLTENVQYIPPIAFSSATEKLNQDQKRLLKRKRKLLKA